MSNQEKQPDDERRVAELLRINGALASEIRDLTLGRRVKPRLAQVPAARTVARLQAERDMLAGELEASKAEVDRLRSRGEELDRHIEELSTEVAQLRGGVSGILRRARARLLLHR
jgi:chromosome segregation ATPase